MKIPAKYQRLQTPLIVAFALGAGCLAVIGMREYISEQLVLESRRLNPKQDWVEVLVAKNDLVVGDSIHEKTIAIRRVPKEFLPGQALPANRFESLAGRKLNTMLKSGDALQEAMLEQRESPVFSSQLRPGVRALSIAVDEINSIAGMLQPGDRIDLHWSVKPPPFAGVPQGHEVTTPLLDDVKVLATGKQVRMHSADINNRNFTTITVEVSPEQAQRLILAQRSGRVTALLRPRDDRGPVESAAMDLSRLLQLRTPAALPVAKTGPEIIVGGRGALTTQTGVQHVPNQ